MKQQSNKLALMFMTLAWTACSAPPAGDNVAPTGQSGDFLSASSVNLERGSAVVEGSIAGAEQTATFLLEPLAIGDRLEVLCFPTGDSALDPVIALFDVDGYVIIWNDNVSPEHGDVYAAIEAVIRYDSPQHFLAVAGTTTADTAGQFRCDIAVQPQATAPAADGQEVVLHWDAADLVEVAGVSFGEQVAFDATAIDSTLADKTLELQDLIAVAVREDFAGVNVQVLSSTTEVTASAPFSTVFFASGLSQPVRILGMSDGVDYFNADRGDSAVILLDSFAGISDLAVAAQVIGNVVSHEIGHLLGLMHTADANTLMDSTGDANSLLADQAFGIAELYNFPIGMQNDMLTLEYTVGRGAARVPAWRCGTCGAEFAWSAAER